MDNKDIVEKIALKIWEITGKTDDRTFQNWKDAEDIVSIIKNF